MVAAPGSVAACASIVSATAEAAGAISSELIPTPMRSPDAA
jgi:hypothetical protein